MVVLLVSTSPPTKRPQTPPPEAVAPATKALVCCAWNAAAMFPREPAIALTAPAAAAETTSVPGNPRCCSSAPRLRPCRAAPVPRRRCWHRPACARGGLERLDAEPTGLSMRSPMLNISPPMLPRRLPMRATVAVLYRQTFGSDDIPTTLSGVTLEQGRGYASLE